MNKPRTFYEVRDATGRLVAVTEPPEFTLLYDAENRNTGIAIRTRVHQIIRSDEVREEVGAGEPEWVSPEPGKGGER